MSRHPAALRPATLAAVAAATLLTLTGCFGGTPVPIQTETPKPTPTGFGTEEPEPIETDVPVEPTDPPVSGFTTLTDDYQVLTIQVPAEWDDVAGEPFTTESGEEWASIAAAPNLDDYFNTWNTPGVEFAGTPTAGRVEDATLVSFLQSVSAYMTDGCTAQDTEQPYDDGFYTGVYSTFTGCGGGETFGFAIVAQNAEGSHAVYVRGQLESEQEEETLNVIISTFQASI